MPLHSLGTLLQEIPEYRNLIDSIESTALPIKLHLLPSALPFVLPSLASQRSYPTLAITPTPDAAEKLYVQLKHWGNPVLPILHFPEYESLPFERIIPDQDTVHQRLSTLSQVVNEDSALIIVASVSALIQSTIDPNSLKSYSHTLAKHQEIDLAALLDRWHQIGYRFDANVTSPGFFSRRGGILDIFPPNSAFPVRIELWGNQIESIRNFDPSTQRSSNQIDFISVIPCNEVLPTLSFSSELTGISQSIDFSDCNSTIKKRINDEIGLLNEGHLVDDLNFYAGLFNRESLLDYLHPQSLLVMQRPSEIQRIGIATTERAAELRLTKELRGELPKAFPSSYLPWDDVYQHCQSFTNLIEVSPWGKTDVPDVDGNTHQLPFRSAPDYFGNTDTFATDVAKMCHSGNRVLAVTSTPIRVVEILTDHGVNVKTIEPIGWPSPEGVTVLNSEGTGLSQGMIMSTEDYELVILGDAEIFGVSKQSRSNSRRSARRNILLAELSPGDFVVHVEHGVGKFIGTGNAESDETQQEYLILQYSQNDRLYVPMDKLDRIARYVAPSDKPPTLTRLGSQEWNRTKTKVQQSAREMASELLTLYANREISERHPNLPQTRWQSELEDSFPYLETADQITAIAQVKDDMEGKKPMDRLICGDVGYGKTEVALRAAFKAVMSGKQVALLVPTTILAQQHYFTFSQRLAAYPVNVEVLSRFRSETEQRTVLDGISEGKVDICIGTHRLIQKDVAFKNLGLVIVDEEQRFGVDHKEQLKKMRTDIDVLTMTATPIPRTLHLSLAGIRDMSTIDSPPEERLPIKTYVSEFNDDLIREAILRELDRQGQVFFLHNRVLDIDFVANHIHKLVPRSRVAVAHGQMAENQLEQVMIDFSNGGTDVLVCTTIIESGLDIPNVNTLIVDRADVFGLAQLYQLRGRIGRSARRAYAYLLIPQSQNLKETAEKRLQTMMAATELGSGFQIAMADLEIRGAGSILGSQQSGHIYAVGFDLYTRLLSEAVESLRAENKLPENSVTNAEPATTLSPAIDLGIPANIPEEYVTDLQTRLSLYRKLTDTSVPQVAEELESEFQDRFGPLPLQVENLIYVAQVRTAAKRAGVVSISRNGDTLVMRLEKKIGSAKIALQSRMQNGTSVGHSQIRINISNLDADWKNTLITSIQILNEFKDEFTSRFNSDNSNSLVSPIRRS